MKKKILLLLMSLILLVAIAIPITTHGSETPETHSVPITVRDYLETENGREQISAQDYVYDWSPEGWWCFSSGIGAPSILGYELVSSSYNGTQGCQSAYEFVKSDCQYVESISIEFVYRRVAPDPTDSPTPDPTDSPTPSPSDTPSPTPSEEPSDTPSPTPTNSPTPGPTVEVTESPTPEVTASPTPKATDSPTPAATETASPTTEVTSTPEVTDALSEEPTESPTTAPTDTQAPATEEPAKEIVVDETEEPIPKPTPAPTDESTPVVTAVVEEIILPDEPEETETPTPEPTDTPKPTDKAKPKATQEPMIDILYIDEDGNDLTEEIILLDADDAHAFIVRTAVGDTLVILHEDVRVTCVCMPSDEPGLSMDSYSGLTVALPPVGYTVSGIQTDGKCDLFFAPSENKIEGLLR